ncbi:MAG: hypothetical protein ABJ024_18465 [Lentilitoribacter sp.]
MLRYIVLTFALIFSFTASADQHQDMIFDASEVFSVTTTDWNSDNVADPVMILNINEGEQFDVLFFLSDEYGRLALKHHVPDMVWGSSAMFGQEPWVSKTQNGSIIVGSQNSAIGRNRWEQKLTIAYRNDKLVVAGFTYSYYDTLDPDAYGGCDLNLLNGKGFKNEKPVRFDINVMTVAEYALGNQNLPEFCYSD